jgi:hypothetical protein
MNRAAEGWHPRAAERDMISMSSMTSVPAGDKAGGVQGAGERWDVERAVRRVLKEMEARWQSKSWPEDEWELLPLIGCDGCLATNLLADVLTDRRLERDGGYTCICELNASHHQQWKAIPKEDRINASEGEEQRAREKDIEQALAWGQKCDPPWDRKSVRSVLFTVSRVRAQRLQALSLGLRGRSAAERLRDKAGQEWAVENVLYPGQATIMGGPEKCLKTSLLMDLSASLESGKPFLGCYRVSRPGRVCFFSGELGGPTLDSLIARVSQSRGADLEGDGLCVVEKLPRLAVPKDLDVLSFTLEDLGAKWVIIDPVYLCLTQGRKDVNPASLFDMGPLLSRAAAACLKVGCTPIFAHHFPKDIALGQRPQLRDLAFAGFREFARQWILVNRRTAYEFDGRHDLLMVTGGSAGHAGLWDVDVDEGKEGDRLTGWQVTVREHAGPTKKGRQATGAPSYGARVRQALRDLAAAGQPATKNRLSQRTGLSKANTARGLAELGPEVEERPVKVPTSNGALREAVDYRLKQPHRDN